MFGPGIFLKRAKDKGHLSGRGKKKGRQESEDRAVGEKCGHIAFWKAKEAVSRRKTQSAVLAWEPCSGDEEGTSDTWGEQLQQLGYYQRVFSSCCIPGDEAHASNQVITKPCPEEAENGVSTEQWALDSSAKSL